MRDDSAWRSFTDTGDPMAYLLYRAVKPPETKEKAESQNTGAAAPA